MLKKRLIGVVTIRNGWVVQSFGYKRFLPIGDPVCVVENLDRWGVDEIFVQVIDRHLRSGGPDLKLIARISGCGIATPIIYGGGIASVEDAADVVRAGADRICIESLLRTNPDEVRGIALKLGSQALIASFPLSIEEKHIAWFNYKTQEQTSITKYVADLLKEKIISEIILIDRVNEGSPNSFDFNLLKAFENIGVPLILFGGLSRADQLKKALQHHAVSAVALGNFLNYTEHAVQKIKKDLAVCSIRPPTYNDGGLLESDERVSSL